MVSFAIDVSASVGESYCAGAALQGAVCTGQPSVPQSIKRILILASQSPQRLALLRQIGFEPLSVPANVDETARPGELASDLVLRLSNLKARSLVMSEVRKCIRENNVVTADTKADDDSGSIVILGADTVIELDGRILGKPRDEGDALEMLQSLSGREHLVHSGVSVYEPSAERTFDTCVTTTVQFGEVTLQVAKRYWQTGEPLNRAGGYAIQGIGAQFVLRLSGSYSNVVGLPLFESAQLLARAGLSSLR